VTVGAGDLGGLIDLLSDLAEETGGRHYPVENLDALPEICARISAEFRSQYLLGYSPESMASDGKYRRVRVEILDALSRVSLHAFWKLGYYAPRE